MSDPEQRANKSGFSPPVLGQCTDRGQDGFYLESGCGLALDCNDDEGSSHPGTVEVCDGRDNACLP